jgi:hypothetical protein
MVWAMRSLTQIANEALADVPAHAISSLDDGSREASECARFLPGIISEMIGYHDWDFVERRVGLAEVTNDRPGEWSHAYALPGQLASPIRLIRPETTNPSFSFETGEGLATFEFVITPMLFWPTTQLPHAAIDYVISDGVLYTDLEQAILEYSTDALEPAKWPALFQQAVIAALTSRILRPLMGAGVTGADVRERKMYARMALDEAVADDLNRNPRQHKVYVSEGAAARLGATGGLTLWRR